MYPDLTTRSPKGTKQAGKSGGMYAARSGTDARVEYGHFDLIGTLADLHSDEGRDPYMVIAPMPSWWSSMYIDAFASPN